MLSKFRVVEKKANFVEISDNAEYLFSSYEICIGYELGFQ